MDSRGRLSRAFARWGARLLLIALVGLAARSQWRCETALDDGLDGAFYFQIARHVSQGDGLVSSLSLYHEALDPLPQRSRFYPLWPLLLGALGAVLGMERAAWWLPRILYLLNLLVLYGLVQGIARRLKWERPFGQRIPLGPGHLALLLLASNPVFRWSTTRTYTEGLATLLVFGTLLAFDRGNLETTPHRNRWLWLSGLLAGAACATRYQLLAIGLALFLVRGLGPRQGRRRDLVALVTGLALPLALVGVHALRAPASSLSQATLAQLPPFSDQVATTGLAGTLVDRLRGFAVAFDPGSQNSYWFQHGPLVLAPPLLLLWLLLRPRALPAVVKPWFEPRHATMSAAALGALLALIPVHLLHFDHWDAWVFGWRQGLPFLWLALPALAYLASRPQRGARLLGLLCVLGSLAWPLAHEIPQACQVNHARSAARRELGAWLDQQTPLPTILGMEPQPLAVTSRARMHWMACWSPPGLAEVLTSNLPIDYLALEGAASLECPSLSGIRQRLIPVLTGKHADWPTTLYRIGPPAQTATGP